ncbi:glycosyltransferase [Rubrivirga marina]|uniref:Glycosyltransferase 2-like domain-containing protein n=1 Tax=Rubrivirga marina TaxID=1196024 RepID=A0A271IX84_9BACT|nr:glycosyltransferase [Rubrivirga marina]PAP75846.1 hypothetical protein BSZ37_05005 [Rubrivirga marina]
MPFPRSSVATPATSACPRFHRSGGPIAGPALSGLSREFEVRQRARPDTFGPISPGLQSVVAVPARDEAGALPRLVAALDAQRDPAGSPFARREAEALVVLNNCSDGSAGVLAALAADRPWLRVTSVVLGPGEAHVGRARQIAMDAACARLLAAGRPDGLVLSTDADSEPAPDWIARTAAEVAAGADAVGGRALLRADERVALHPGVRRLYLLDLAYRRALEELRDLYAPDLHDPFPRHHHHFGASLAVTAGAYAWVGGLPAVPSSEDVALTDALVEAGARLRHSPAVRVRTSARSVGRAPGGLADAFRFWAGAVADRREPLVEPAADAERRLARLGLVLAEAPDGPPPRALRTTPEPLPGLGQALPAAIDDLRRRIAALRPLSLATRLDHAARLVAPPALALAA